MSERRGQAGRPPAAEERSLPASLGYRMPAEWEPHEATWLAWPHEREDWPAKFEPIPWVFGEVVRALAPGERVRILVDDAAHEEGARTLLARVAVDPSRVDFVRVRTDRVWTRDSCPLFVRDAAGTVAMTNWKFNGWAKYPNHLKDDAINDQLAPLLGMKQWKPCAGEGTGEGAGARRLTTGKGDVSPVFNPKTNGQIAWVSGRTGLPQIYAMDVDGSNVQRMTDQGYAVSPAWSPNGLLLAFAWVRNYGPGVLGGSDIYLMDIASRQIIQLTHDGGRNDFPSWSPDGRHIVFQSNRGGMEQVWSVLADGTHLQQLTRQGRNSQPNWSFK